MVFKSTAANGGVVDPNIHPGPTPGSFKPVKDVGFDPRRHTRDAVPIKSLDRRMRERTDEALKVVDMILAGKDDDGKPVSHSMRLKAAELVINRGWGRTPESDKIALKDVSVDQIKSMTANELTVFLAEQARQANAITLDQVERADNEGETGETD